MESSKKEKKQKKEKKEKEIKEESEDEEVEKKSKKKKETKESTNFDEKRVFPLADKALSKDILELINIATQNKLIKKGANEATKTLNRGISELIVLAADADPLEIILHLPLLCEDKNVPYVFVESQKLLGRSCGVKRPVIACSIINGMEAKEKETLETLKTRIEQLLLVS